MCGREAGGVCVLLVQGGVSRGRVCVCVCVCVIHPTKLLDKMGYSRLSS